MQNHTDVVEAPADARHCRTLLQMLFQDPDFAFPLRRRANPRWALAAPAALQYTLPGEPLQLAEGSVQDLSLQGIGLHCWKHVPVGTTARVYVCADNTLYRAEVQVAHSTQMQAGFRIGCRFVP